MKSVHVNSTTVGAPRHERQIVIEHPGVLSAVLKMSFSPDGQFLGFVDMPNFGISDLVVWDVLNDRKVFQIRLPYNYGALSDHDLLWSQNGQVLSFGAKRQWSSTTGEALQDNPAIGRNARLNDDGSRLATIVGTIGAPTDVHVYETSTWKLKSIHVDGFAVGTLSWISHDKILVTASPTRENAGKTFGGHLVQNYFDSALILLDATGQQEHKYHWFAAKPMPDPKVPFAPGFPILSQAIPNFKTHEAIFNAGMIVDLQLDERRYCNFDFDDIAPGAFGMGVSPDGRLLYLKGAVYATGAKPPIKNSIVDLTTGKPILQFDGTPGSYAGLAISPDGKLLALSNFDGIDLYRTD